MVMSWQHNVDCLFSGHYGIFKSGHFLSDGRVVGMGERPRVTSATCS